MKGGFNVFTQCDTIQLYNYIMLLTKKTILFQISKAVSSLLQHKKKFRKLFKACENF